MAVNIVRLAISLRDLGSELGNQGQPRHRSITPQHARMHSRPALPRLTALGHTFDRNLLAADESSEGEDILDRAAYASPLLGRRCVAVHICHGDGWSWRSVHGLRLLLSLGGGFRGLCSDRAVVARVLAGCDDGAVVAMPQVQRGEVTGRTMRICRENSVFRYRRRLVRERKPASTHGGVGQVVV